LLTSYRLNVISWRDYMEKKALTVVESLRFANHDFMNHLHLINMNLDLGQIQEIKNILNHISEKYRSYSNINNLLLPNTVEWLYTLGWRFPNIQLTINGLVTDSNYTQNDDEIVEYLEETIKHVYNGLDPYCEHQLLITIESIKNQFKLQFQLKGKWDSKLFQPKKMTNIKVQTYEETNNSWKYVLTSE
jgi:stage 0 sporulation protein B (sporulation initiation phosphotransferase)